MMLPHKFPHVLAIGSAQIQAIKKGYPFG